MKKNSLIFMLFIGPMLFQHGVYDNEGLDLDLAILKINKDTFKQISGLLKQITESNQSIS